MYMYICVVYGRWERTSIVHGWHATNQPHTITNQPTHSQTLQKHKADPARAEDDQLNLFGMEAGNHLRCASSHLYDML